MNNLAELIIKGSAERSTMFGVLCNLIDGAGNPLVDVRNVYVDDAVAEKLNILFRQVEVDTEEQGYYITGLVNSQPQTVQRATFELRIRFA